MIGIPAAITDHALAVFARLIAIWFGIRYVTSLSPKKQLLRRSQSIFASGYSRSRVSYGSRTTLSPHTSAAITVNVSPSAAYCLYSFVSTSALRLSSGSFSAKSPDISPISRSGRIASICSCGLPFWRIRRRMSSTRQRCAIRMYGCSCTLSSVGSPG